MMQLIWSFFLKLWLTVTYPLQSLVPTQQRTPLKSHVAQHPPDWDHSFSDGTSHSSVKFLEPFSSHYATWLSESIAIMTGDAVFLLADEVIADDSISINNSLCAPLNLSSSSDGSQRDDSFVMPW